MSILDDAIREHLELKRRHGADDSELKQLEDEAFGPAERPSSEEALPDPLAEAPTEFMTPAPEGVEEKEGSRREPAPGIADLQEGPEPPRADSVEEPTPAPEAEPVEEEHPAMEHEAVPEAAAEPSPPAEHSTEERHAIAEQPTELFDVEGEIAASESRSPSDDELIEEEMQEPRLAPVDPLAGLEEVDEEEVSVAERAEDAAVEAEEEDDFFDEQRLSEELDQALEAPVASTPAPVEPPPALGEDDVDEEGDLGVDLDDEEVDEDDGFEEDEEAEEEEHPTGDVLGGTPDFLEETPEDDQLWFEQKPPKDFDFDD